MEAVYCKGCKRRHNGPCNIFYNTVGEDSVRQSESNKAKKLWGKPELGIYVRQISLTPADSIPVSGSSKFDKVAYQREYMRKKRAEGGIKGEVLCRSSR